MAKHRPRFLPKALIGMSAVTGLTVMVSTPARAETIDLICINGDLGQQLQIDTDRRSVNETINGHHYGPFSASISDTLIQWVDPGGGIQTQYTIDRVAGTIRRVELRGGRDGMEISISKCRRATQKF